MIGLWANKHKWITPPDNPLWASDHDAVSIGALRSSTGLAVAQRQKSGDTRQTDVLIWPRRADAGQAKLGMKGGSRLSLLVLQDIGKEFGAIRALSHVNLTIGPGEVVGLMGDNGAGKSTLVKIIAGNFPASHGKVLFEDQEVHFTRPIDARSVGIEVVYQDLALADNLTAAANVFLGRELKRKVG